MSHTVLLVDDDVNLLAALQRALRREPYDVLGADGPERAFAVLASRPIAVVVSDESMPGMSGTEFLAGVHTAYPDTIRIVLTGHASLEVAIRSINQGAVYRFLTKPCHPTELAFAIRQGLQQRELLVQSRRLLRAVRRQAAMMDDLEREARGITHVVRDDSGAIVLAEGAADIETVLKEMQEELDAADRRLGALAPRG
jgi:two-component system, probable response regulator PhcQ